jgi:hypothetical protein
MSKIWSTERYMFPTQLHPKETVRPELALSTVDIPGATPSPDAFRSHARGTNPLHPTYDLPGHSLDWVPQAEPDRFVRDSIDVGDIEGARSKRHVRNRPGFTTLGAEDIEGAAPGYKPFFRRHVGTVEGQRDGISCADINAKSSPRVAAPRSPYPDGDVEGSKPRALTQGRSDGEYVDMSLKSTDISGAVPWRQPGNLNDPFTPKFERRQFRATNNTADIVGTSPTSYVSRLPVSAHAALVAKSEEQREQATAAAVVTGAIITDATTLRALKGKLEKCETDGSGKVSSQEFVAAVRGSGLGVAGEELRQLRDGMADETGLMDYRPFISALYAKASARPVVKNRPQTANSSSSSSSGKVYSRQGSKHACSRPQTAGSRSSSSRASSRPPSGTSSSSRPTYRSSRPASAPGNASGPAIPPPSHTPTRAQPPGRQEERPTSEGPKHSKKVSQVRFIVTHAIELAPLSAYYSG